MSLKVLYKSGALGAGSDLWVVPSLKQTNWTKIVNWYLNFQLAKAQTFCPQPPPENLNHLLKEFSFKDHRVESQAPLFICSSEFFPNQMVVKLVFPDEKDWAHKAYTIWKAFQRPSLRLFLPRTLKETEFESLWLSFNASRLPTKDMTVVPGL